MMACHAWNHPSMCVVQCLCGHVTLDVVRLCVFSKVHDCMPRPMTSDCVCRTKAMFSCNALNHHFICAVQRLWWHSTPDVVLPCVLSNGYEDIPCLILSDIVCCPRAIMDCHTWCCPTMCAVQGLCEHAKPDVIRSCIPSTGDDHMPCPTSSYCVLTKIYSRMPRPTLSGRVCCPTATWACHALYLPTVCSVQGRWWHATPNVVRSCVLSKGNNVVPTRHRLFVCVIKKLWWHDTTNIVRPCMLSN